MIAFASFFFSFRRLSLQSVMALAPYTPECSVYRLLALLLYTICTVVHESEISIFIPTVLTVRVSR
jgi:hypothetical protein